MLLTTDIAYLKPYLLSLSNQCQQIEKTLTIDRFLNPSRHVRSQFLFLEAFEIFLQLLDLVRVAKKNLGPVVNRFRLKKKLSWFLVEKSVFVSKRSILKMFKYRERKITHLLQIWSNLILFLLLYWIWSQMHLKILHFLSLCIKGCVFNGGIVPLIKFFWKV